MKTTTFHMIGVRAVLSVLLACAGWLSPAAVQPAHAATDYCFGAAGQGCGGWTFGEMPRFAFCVPLPASGGKAICSVSGGSMTHDPCCATSPNGKMCGGPGRETTQCRAEWDKAVSRAFWGYQWNRVVDTRRGNSTGIVERPLYCANRGAAIHKNDDQHCCSRSSRPGNFWERLGRPNLDICK